MTKRTRKTKTEKAVEEALADLTCSLWRPIHQEVVETLRFVFDAASGRLLLRIYDPDYDFSRTVDLSKQFQADLRESNEPEQFQVAEAALGRLLDWLKKRRQELER